MGNRSRGTKSTPNSCRGGSRARKIMPEHPCLFLSAFTKSKMRELLQERTFYFEFNCTTDVLFSVGDN